MNHIARLGLDRDPFVTTMGERPTTAPQLVGARDRVLEHAAAGKPVVFVTGRPGTGKSTLLTMLADEAVRRGLSVRCIDRGDRAQEAIGASVDLLLIDEADSIIDATLAALAPGQGKPAARTIVFAALTPFPHRLLNGGAASTIQLEQLDPTKARSFLVSHAVRAGRADLFNDRALDLIVDAARGSPRRLRVLGSAALFHAAADNAKQIQPEHVVQALKMQPESLLTMVQRAQAAALMPEVAAPAEDLDRDDRPAASAAPTRTHTAWTRFSSHMALAVAMAIVALAGPSAIVGTLAPDAVLDALGIERPGKLMAAPPRYVVTSSSVVPDGTAAASVSRTIQAGPRLAALAGGSFAVPPLIARPELRTAAIADTPRPELDTRVAPIMSELRSIVATARADMPDGVRSLALDLIAAARLRPLVIARQREPARGEAADSVEGAALQEGLVAFAGQGALAPGAVSTAVRTASLSPTLATAVVPATAVFGARSDNASAKSVSSVGGQQFVLLASDTRPSSDMVAAAEGGRSVAADTQAARLAAEQAKAAAEQASAARNAAEQAKATKGAAEAAEAAKLAAEQARAAKAAADLAKAAAEQAKASKEAAERARATKEAAELTKLAADQAKAAKAAAEQAQAAKDAAEQAKASKNAAEQAKAAKEAAEQAQAAKLAAEQAKAAKDAAEQAKAAKAAAEEAQAAKEAAEQAKAAKAAAEAAQAAKLAAEQARAAKDAADQAKAAAEQAKAAKDAAEQARAAKDAAKDAVRDAKDAAKAAKEARKSARGG